ncbi:DUF262 domain-containing protein [Psychroserpens mesophilus]|uniref:DUF262 domain-containing protein n=1 Tax=Psychroserpens mesophilus TaxID=325473 RepID=UPI00058ED035|nr:DUF262 domain-containing protein [Psychroserpens mesophilus]
MNDNKFELKSIHQLENYHFVVEKYQRGYKWDIRQVEELLNDIEEFDASKNGFYCLQPIVIKELSENCFELLDGQQRSTTLFIILSILQQENILKTDVSRFTISYKTRTASETFLKDIHNLHSVTEQVTELNQKSVNALWENYIELHKTNDNVDNYHFFMAYYVIRHWVNDRNQIDLNSFKDKLLYNTKVIWYNVVSNTPSEEVFINFNQGKIDLAQAELIKALFVLQLKNETNHELQILKINQFAQEWNAIENKLQDDSFWYFVSNDNSDKDQANRIDLLFNIVKEKANKSNDKLFAYRKYLDDFIEENKAPSLTEDPLQWFEVKNTYDILLEWYNNRSLYHLIGFIIYEKLSDIKSIIGQYKEITSKSVFREDLTKLIREKYIDAEKYRLENLSYETPRQTHSILLLFNLISYENSDFSYRFPFHLFKTTFWSLEHIHAQNSEKFETVIQVVDWVKDLKSLNENFKKANEHQEITIDFSEIDDCIKTLDTHASITKELKDVMSSLETLTNDVFNKHSLENLCLLDGVTNSHFNNDNFVSKRDKLLKIDAGSYLDKNDKRVKAFIPLATKNIFLKYYSQDTLTFQMSYWGYEDRKQYVGAIAQTFASFFNLKLGKDGE